jgi:peptide/nickel transport system substrate-binding protein
VPLFYPEYPGFDPAWKPYPYDPEKAKELLAEAGYKPGDMKIKMALTHHTVPTQTRVAEAAAQYWRELGMNVSLETLDYNNTFKPAANKRRMAGYIFSFTDPYRFDYTTFMVYIAHSKSWYGWAFDDPEFDKMMDAAMSELDAGKREKLMNAMGDYVYKGRLAIPVAYLPRLFATSSKIKDWPLSPAGAWVTTNLEFLTITD